MKKVIFICCISLMTIGCSKDTDGPGGGGNGGGSDSNPSITITSPNGGQSWEKGSIHAITWNSTGIIGYVKIELCDGYTATNTLKNSVSINDKTWSWEISSDISAGSNCRIKITSISNNNFYDHSNSTFSITEPILNPTKATLVYPNKDETCTTGTNLSDDECDISFEWRAGDNTDSYQLELTNLSTNNIESFPTSELTKVVTVKRGTPYSWKVISKSNSTTNTAQSETWKFYTAGIGIESYAPFPAEIISPKMGEIITTSNSVISLEWNSSDTDGDIAGHDVYFGASNAPNLLKSDIQEMFLNEVSISSGTYYWKIITKDSKGNTSDSGVYYFTIN